jgi:hypothetical protein
MIDQYIHGLVQKKELSAAEYEWLVICLDRLVDQYLITSEEVLLEYITQAKNDPEFGRNCLLALCKLATPSSHIQAKHFMKTTNSFFNGFIILKTPYPRINAILAKHWFILAMTIWDSEPS